MAVFDNLSVYWKFEEESGNFIDASGQGNDGVPTATPTRNTLGKVDRSVTFNGTTQWVSAANATELQAGANDISIAFWWKPASLPSVSGSADIVVSKNQGDPNAEYWVALSSAVQAFDHFAFAASPDGLVGSNVAVRSAVPVSAGTWYFVVCRFDSSAEEISISVNAETPVTADLGSNTIFAGVSAFRAGAFASGTLPADGEIDEVAMWKGKHLTTDEIATLYNSGAGRHVTEATEVVSTINPAGGGDYTSLSAWEADQQANISAANERHIAEVVEGNGGSVVIDGWTTDSDCYVEIRPQTGAAHSGAYEAGANARMDLGASGAEIREAHTRITNMQVDANAGVNCFNIVQNAALVNCLIDGCVFGPSGRLCVVTNGLSGKPHTIRNCVAHSMAQDGIEVGATGAAAVYNCTIHALTGAVALELISGGSLVENNNYLSAATAGNTYGGTGEGSISKGANTATSDTEAATAALDSIAFSTDNFVDPSNGDCHLTATSALLQQGARLASVFTNDVDGAGTRPVTAEQGGWDIGADQRTFFVPLPAPGETFLPHRPFRGGDGGPKLKSTDRSPSKFTVEPARLPQRSPRGPAHLLDWIGGGS